MSMEFEAFKRPFRVERISFAVRMDETDPYGVVNNAVFYNYFETARLLFLQANGIPAEDFLRTFALEYVSIKYIAGLRFGDTAEIVSRIRQVTEASVEFEQLLTSDKSGKTVARSAAIYRYQNGSGV